MMGKSNWCLGGNGVGGETGKSAGYYMLVHRRERRNAGRFVNGPVHRLVIHSHMLPQSIGEDFRFHNTGRHDTSTTL